MTTIYYLETQYAHNGWTAAFLELVVHLMNKLDVKLVHQLGGHLHIPEYGYDIPDCELIIYDDSKDILKAITWSESPTNLFKIFTDRDNPNDILLLAQNAYWFPPNYDYSKHKFSIKPTTFYTFSPQTNHDYYYT